MPASLISRNCVNCYKTFTAYTDSPANTCWNCYDFNYVSKNYCLICGVEIPPYQNEHLKQFNNFCFSCYSKNENYKSVSLKFDIDNSNKESLVEQIKEDLSDKYSNDFPEDNSPLYLEKLITNLRR